MNEILITGHKNPDMDSVCSAYAYAVLKNITDKDSNYTAVRCGHLTEGVRKQFEAIDVTPPVYRKDVIPRVSDVMLTPDFKIQASSPIYELVTAFSTERPSVYPVFDGDTFKGLLSVDDIAYWFLKDSSDSSPVYDFSIENIAKVVPGNILHAGKMKTFKASVMAGTLTTEDFRRTVTNDYQSIIVMGGRNEHIRHAVKMNVPAIIISSSASKEVDVNFDNYSGTVFVTDLTTAEAIRRLRMSPSVESMMGEQGPTFQVTDFFDDAKEVLTSSNFRGLSVYDGESLAGFVTRRCFLSKPRYKVILVDHNEVGQSIKGIESADVMEIIDHHRLDALKTSSPIYIDAEPVGSTCTIVYQQFIRKNVVPDRKTALVLLSGIIADTVILRSPTTTVTDKLSAGALAAIAGEYDIKAFGERMFSRSSGMSSRNMDEAVASDFKVYKEHGVTFGIGQCEVTTLEDCNDYTNDLLNAVSATVKRNGLDWAMVMVTDVLKERSLLFSSQSNYLRKIPYTPVADFVYDMPGVMSRKKQLLPEIIHCLD